jgi:hypothetical protein
MYRHPTTSIGTDRAVNQGRHHHVGGTALVIILVAGLSLIVAPTASATQPTRTVITRADFVVPAGFGCAFDVQVHHEAGYREIRFEFSDGRLVRIVNGERTLTNLETGAMLTWQNDFQRTEVTDPVTNDLLIENSGRAELTFWPGDVDHNGQVVGESGGWYGFVGHVEATIDGGTFVLTNTAQNGTAIDLCALLAE